MDTSLGRLVDGHVDIRDWVYWYGIDYSVARRARKTDTSVFDLPGWVGIPCRLIIGHDQAHRNIQRMVFYRILFIDLGPFPATCHAVLCAAGTGKCMRQTVRIETLYMLRIIPSLGLPRLTPIVIVLLTIYLGRPCMTWFLKLR